MLHSNPPSRCIASSPLARHGSARSDAEVFCGSLTAQLVGRTCWFNSADFCRSAGVHRRVGACVLDTQIVRNGSRSHQRPGAPLIPLSSAMSDCPRPLADPKIQGLAMRDKMGESAKLASSLALSRPPQPKLLHFRSVSLKPTGVYRSLVIQGAVFSSSAS